MSWVFWRVRKLERTVVDSSGLTTTCSLESQSVPVVLCMPGLVSLTKTNPQNTAPQYPGLLRQVCHTCIPGVGAPTGANSIQAGPPGSICYLTPTLTLPSSYYILIYRPSYHSCFNQNNSTGNPWYFLCNIFPNKYLDIVVRLISSHKKIRFGFIGV